MKESALRKLGDLPKKVLDKITAVQNDLSRDSVDLNEDWLSDFKVDDLVRFIEAFGGTGVRFVNLSGIHLRELGADDLVRVIRAFEGTEIRSVDLSGNWLNFQTKDSA